MKRLQKIGLSALLFGTMVFASCATTKNTLATAKKLGKVYVTNTNKIQLLTPQYMSGDVDALYVFSADFGKQSFSALSYFYSDSEEMSMTLLSDFGLEMGSLYFNGEEVDFAIPMEASIKGEYIVSDLENIFYNEASLEENYRSAGLNFTVEQNGRTITKTVSTSKKVVERITMTVLEDGTVDEVYLENILRGYTYKLKLAEE